MKKDAALHMGVVGGGSWGSALAHVLASKGHMVTLFVRKAHVAEHINVHHKNPHYVQGHALHEDIKATCDMSLLRHQEIVVLALSAQHMRQFLVDVQVFLPFGIVLVNASKGLEVSRQVSLQGADSMTMGQVVKDVLAHKAPQYAMLSGPSFADEVLNAHPTAVVLGCGTQGLDHALQTVFSSPLFRCYSCKDVLGVEFGGALKNVIALATGVCDGLGFGHNTRAALLTRGLAEIRRLGVAAGAQDMTFMGLSGIGDLMLTCTGDLSRNRQVGLRLGRGEKLHDIVQSLGMVAEGVSTTKAAYSMAQNYAVNAPIINTMYDILYNDVEPYYCVQQLMARRLTEE